MIVYKRTHIQFSYQSVLKMSSMVSLILLRKVLTMYGNDLGTDIERVEIPEEYKELVEEYRGKAY